MANWLVAFANEPVLRSGAEKPHDWWMGGVLSCLDSDCTRAWVTVRDLEVGDVLTHDDVQLIPYPTDFVVPEALRSGDDPIGLRMQHDTGAGIVLTPARLLELDYAASDVWWEETTVG